MTTTSDLSLVLLLHRKVDVLELLCDFQQLGAQPF